MSVFFRFDEEIDLNFKLPPDAFAKLDGAEQQAACQGEDEYEQEHAHDNEETFVHGDDYSQHQHLECGVFAGDGEKTQNNHHEPK